MLNSHIPPNFGSSLARIRESLFSPESDKEKIGKSEASENEPDKNKNDLAKNNSAKGDLAKNENSKDLDDKSESKSDVPPPPKPKIRFRKLQQSSLSRQSSSHETKQRLSKIFTWVILGVGVVVFIILAFVNQEVREEIPYSKFLEFVEGGDIKEGEYDNTNGQIKITTNTGANLRSSGPVPLPDDHTYMINEKAPEFHFLTNRPNFLLSILPLLLPVTLLILFFWLMQRPGVWTDGWHHVYWTE